MQQELLDGLCAWVTPSKLNQVSALHLPYPFTPFHMSVLVLFALSFFSISTRAINQVEEEEERENEEEEELKKEKYRNMKERKKERKKHSDLGESIE